MSDLPVALPMQMVREIARLRDRIAELEELCGLSIEVPVTFDPRPRTNYSRLRMWTLICFLAKRTFITKAGVIAVLYGDLHADERPDAKIVDVYICHVRKFLRLNDIVLSTSWGEGWYFDQANRAKIRTLIERLRAADRELVA